jgi:hypothetical protein
MARAIDQLVKDLPKDSAYRYRRKTLADQKEIEPTLRTDISWVSKPDVDITKEVVIPTGMALDDFRTNPVVLSDHESSRVCGRCVWIKATDEGVLAKTEYPARKEDNTETEWLPEKIWQLVQCNLLRGKSVGFLPLEVREPTPEELELPEFLGCELVIAQSYLIEYSCVSTPCCPSALVEAIGKGFKPDLSKAIFDIKRIGRVAERKAPTKRQLTPLDIARAVKGIVIDTDAIAQRLLEEEANWGKV